MLVFRVLICPFPISPLDKVLKYTHSLLQNRLSFLPDILIDPKYILFELFLERIVYHDDD